ncbi:MAG: hypothetical protein ACI9OJ_000218 [Myxococcota bacterium]
MRSTLVALLLMIALVGCSSDEETRLATDVGNDTASSEDTSDVGAVTPIVVVAGCHPLAPNGHCMLPFPSDVFLKADPSMPSGMVADYQQPALPQNKNGEGLNPRAPFAADGASVLPHIMTVFAEGVEPSDLISYSDDVSKSLEADNKTIVIDAETGRRILHLSELDPRTTDPAEQALVIRPLEPLEYERRYIVAIRGLHTPAGTLIEASPAFAVLRDGRAAEHPDLAAEAERYAAQILPVLAAHNIATDTLQLAWDFTTGSRERPTADMLKVRELAMASFAANAPKITVTEVVDNPNDQIGRKVVGTMTVPLFLNVPDVGGVLTRDSNGLVMQNGVTEVPFTIQIPKSVFNGDVPGPVRVIQYGHGFFGQRSEIEGSFSRGFAQEFSTIFMAVDWWGMDSGDRGLVAEKLLKDPNQVLIFTERLHQGMVNQMALTHAAKGPFLALDELKRADVTLFDPAQIYWYGISQGHILGGTFLALSDHIDRGVLGVGGAGFSHMMFRSSNFAEFVLLLNAHTKSPLEHQKFVAMTQTVIDRFDPVNYAKWVMDEPLAGGPQKRQLLIQVGLGDPQVPNMTAHMHVRALGLKVLEPATKPVALLDTVKAPAESAYVEFDFGLESPLPGDTANLPDDEDDPVHEGVRRAAGGRSQVDAFLKPDGMVANFCDGVCDPE